jgi:hypothetical protein
VFMTSTNRAWLVLSPIVLFLGAQFGAPLVASASPGAFVFTLAITSFVVTGVLTWASVRAERLVVPRVVDHLRQASLLYVSAAVGLVLRFSSSAADIRCFVCPPPWAAVVLPAVAANILVLALVRVRPFAA